MIENGDVFVAVSNHCKCEIYIIEKEVIDYNNTGKHNYFTLSITQENQIVKERICKEYFINSCVKLS